MTNVTGINKRPYLTKHDIFNSISEELGDSDKLMMVGLKEDGELVVFTTNNMTPMEEVAMSAYMYNGAMNFLANCHNVNNYSPEQWV